MFVKAFAGTTVAVVSLLLVAGAASDGDANAAGAVVGIDGVPEQYVDAVVRAGSMCPPDVTPSLLAAQLEAESGWNKNAVSGAGAQGLAQFMPGTWAAHGGDGDGDGRADPFNAFDAIASQGAYMCELNKTIHAWLEAGVVKGDAVELTLAAYNAGLGSVKSAGGVPGFGETQAYVKKIPQAAATKFVEHRSGGGPAPVAGSGNAALLEQAKKALGTPYLLGGITLNGLDCSGLVFWSRQQLGKPLPASCRTADAMIKCPNVTEISEDQLQPGDLIAFRNRGSIYGHMSIYVGEDDTGHKLIIHAPRPGKVVQIQRLWYTSPLRFGRFNDW